MTIYMALAMDMGRHGMVSCGIAARRGTARCGRLSDGMAGNVVPTVSSHTFKSHNFKARAEIPEWLHISTSTRPLKAPSSQSLGPRFQSEPPKTRDVPRTTSLPTTGEGPLAGPASRRRRRRPVSQGSVPQGGGVSEGGDARAPSAQRAADRRLDEAARSRAADESFRAERPAEAESCAARRGVSGHPAPQPKNCLRKYEGLSSGWKCQILPY